MYESALNGVSTFPSLFPLGNPFLSQTSASQLLGDTAMQQSITPTAVTSNTSTPSLLSSAGSSSPVVAPLTIGESALQSAAKVSTASHGNNNGGESASGD